MALNIDEITIQQAHNGFLVNINDGTADIYKNDPEEIKRFLQKFADYFASYYHDSLNGRAFLVEIKRTETWQDNEGI